MKLTDKTVKILKNYSEINSGITIKKGNRLTTISGGPSTIVSSADVGDNFPKDFSLHNLDKFLAIQSLFNQPEFEFNDTNVLIKDGNRSVEYFYANNDAVKSPKKTPPIPSTGIEFTLTAQDFASIKKASSILQYEHLVISGDGKKITVQATKAGKGQTSGNFKLDTNISTDKKFSTTLIINHLKMIEGNYDVKVGEEFVYFNEPELGLQYWVVLATE